LSHSLDVSTTQLVKVPLPTRNLGPADAGRSFPLYVVWEITMKCDQPCQHCGSRSGRARVSELSTEEALEVAASLVRMGSREVTLIGGEAYLREDCATLIEALAKGGVRVTMQTGGRAFTLERARRFREAGLSGLGVSIDGLAKAHDQLRGNLGSFAATWRALENARAVGLITSANTQINKVNMPDLEGLAARLRKEGVQTWQVQLTGPLGKAADFPERIIDPWEIVEIIDRLAAIQLEAMREFEAGGKQGIPFNVFANNNIGYYGPHEKVLRSVPYGKETHWRGCVAGIYSLGIESDGTLKACPTLPTKPYAAANVREMTIEDVWERSEILRFARDRGTEELWGFCKTCDYGEICQGGCSWTAHSTLGRRGNNPFCYHRVIQLRKKGVRERLIPVERAPGVPFDFGRFEIREEPDPRP
jgi:radical SAM protein with 4Fe4S-binding SPASM domain